MEGPAFSFALRKATRSHTPVLRAEQPVLFALGSSEGPFHPSAESAPFLRFVCAPRGKCEFFNQQLRPAERKPRKSLLSPRISNETQGENI